MSIPRSGAGSSFRYTVTAISGLFFGFFRDTDTFSTVSSSLIGRSIVDGISSFPVQAEGFQDLFDSQIPFFIVYQILSNK